MPPDLMHVNITKSTVNHIEKVNLVDACLPQTPCRQCGYVGCKPYAVAIVDGEADINQCPPGGEAGVRQLAKLMGVQYKPLNPIHGTEKPKAIAFIVEETCIGCTLCIQACPVDAILGASKMMHTVISQECTGCELCLPVCPMDCIVMEPIIKSCAFIKLDSVRLDSGFLQKIAQETQEFKATNDLARERYNFRLLRQAREQQEATQKQLERAEFIKANAAKAMQSAAINSILQFAAIKNKHD